MSRCQLLLIFLNGSDAQERKVAINMAVIAGWTGRDPAAVEKHIVELEALGVQRPASTPIFYRVAAARLTTDGEIEASGTQSGGEVEYLLLRHGGRTWVGVGSDHTDREVEKFGVTVSKQMCDKPIAPQFWAYDDVTPHWDRLILRSFVVEHGKRAVYQDGPVAAMLHPKDLLSRFAADGVARPAIDRHAPGNDGQRRLELNRPQPVGEVDRRRSSRGVNRGDRAPERARPVVARVGDAIRLGHGPPTDCDSP